MHRTISRSYGARVANCTRQLPRRPTAQEITTRDTTGHRLYPIRRGRGLLSLLTVTLVIAGIVSALLVLGAKPLLPPMAAAYIPLATLAGTIGFAIVRRLLRPQPFLTLSPPMVAVGGTVRLAWTIPRNAGRLVWFEIALEGHEVVTDDSEDANDPTIYCERFHSQSIVKLVEHAKMKAGAIELTVPAGTMHSFVTKHTAIAWSLRARGVTGRWSTVDEEFSIRVMPAP